jgi:hypothetical protein
MGLYEWLNKKFVTTLDYINRPLVDPGIPPKLTDIETHHKLVR